MEDSNSNGIYVALLLLLAFKAKSEQCTYIFALESIESCSDLKKQTVIHIKRGVFHDC